MTLTRTRSGATPSPATCSGRINSYQGHTPITPYEMLYTYEKDGKVMAIEICSATTSKGFELRRKDVNGSEIVETFESPEELNRRLMKIETDLLTDGWFLGGTARTG